MLDQPLDQPLIKAVLLVAVVVITLMLNASTADSRHQAVRRLLLVVASSCWPRPRCSSRGCSPRSPSSSAWAGAPTCCSTG
ncbi:hypothetical protein [Ornithinimicrobium sp. W1665]|uniref:hypothetical protein n=1 Tax=Ornithinimicrobium sp. W1665 TaxID=3416666 RepID=UPI003D6B6A25